MLPRITVIRTCAYLRLALVLELEVVFFVVLFDALELDVLVIGKLVREVDTEVELSLLLVSRGRWVLAAGIGISTNLNIPSYTLGIIIPIAIIYLAIILSANTLVPRSANMLTLLVCTTLVTPSNIPSLVYQQMFSSSEVCSILG